MTLFFQVIVKLSKTLLSIINRVDAVLFLIRNYRYISKRIKNFNIVYGISQYHYVIYNSRYKVKFKILFSLFCYNIAEMCHRMGNTLNIYGMVTYDGLSCLKMLWNLRHLYCSNYDCFAFVHNKMCESDCVL